MDTLESMRAFVRVVELGSFAAAARSLRISPAMVSKHIAYLESRMGARLLNRSTRHVSPTDAGQVYFERCVPLLSGIEETENMVGANAAQPRGTLKVTAPVEFGNAHLGPLMGQFLKEHPEIDLILDFSNRIVDMIQEGYDVSIRITKALDTALIGRRLATSHFLIAASPEYLEKHGRPATPQALADHPCMSFAVPTPWDEWQFAKDGETAYVKVRSILLSSSSEALRQGALAGAGICMLPSFICGSDLEEGRLISIFPEYDIGSLNIYALFPHRQFLPARVRLFLDFLTRHFGTEPDRDPWMSRVEALSSHPRIAARLKAVGGKR